MVNKIWQYGEQYCHIRWTILWRYWSPYCQYRKYCYHIWQQYCLTIRWEYSRLLRQYLQFSQYSITTHRNNKVFPNTALSYLSNSTKKWALQFGELLWKEVTVLEIPFKFLKKCWHSFYFHYFSYILFFLCSHIIGDVWRISLFVCLFICFRKKYLLV